MRFLRAVVRQLLSVPFRSFRGDFYKVAFFWALHSRQSLSWAVCESLILFISFKWKSVWGRAEVCRGSAWKAGLDWVRFADYPGAVLGSGLNL